MEDHIHRVNPRCGVIRVSATTGEGLEDWHAWLRQQKAIILAGQQSSQCEHSNLRLASDSDEPATASAHLHGQVD
jgi:nicotinamidase-related amidase